MKKNFYGRQHKGIMYFSYSKIAEYYAHSKEEMQSLMEKSALVIIDFDKAVENGYTRLSQTVISQYEEEYEG